MNYTRIAENEATVTHVPRAWYDSQRAALQRAEMQNVALLARITELHKQLETRGVAREAGTLPSTSEAFNVGSTVSGRMKSTAVSEQPKAKRSTSRELDITF